MKQNSTPIKSFTPKCFQSLIKFIKITPNLTRGPSMPQPKGLYPLWKEKTVKVGGFIKHVMREWE
jgi:hypothetical protein